jgi:hypothetical protein
MGTNGRIRRWVAVSVGVVGSTAVAVGQAPTPPATPEIYYGTTRINPPTPEPPPAKPVEDPTILPAAARLLVGPVTPEAPAGAPLATMMSASRDATEASIAAAKNTLKSLFDRMTVMAEPKRLPLLKVSHTTPAMPEPVIAGPASQPTVIVVREPASAPAVAPMVQPVVVETRAEAPAAAQWSPESLIAIGVSAAGLLSTLMLWGRVGRGSQQQPVVVYAGSAPMPTAAPPAPVPAKPAGATLLDGYAVGPLPESAETFEIGPTYADERKMKLETEERNKDAMALHVLDQNLALLDDEPATEPAVA